MSKCIFCEIAEKKVSSDIVYESDKVLGFRDIAAQAPVHILLIPKDHMENVLDLRCRPDTQQALFDGIFECVSVLGLQPDGFRVVTNTGSHGGQTVNHLHFHILAGRPLHWPPG